MIQMLNRDNLRAVLGFSCIFAFTFVFVLEPALILQLTEFTNLTRWNFYFLIMPAHGLGLILSATLYKKTKGSFQIIRWGPLLILVSLTLFLFSHLFFHILGLMLISFISGLMVAMAGLYIRTFVNRENRLLLSALPLMFTHIIYGIVRLVAIYTSVQIGLIVIILAIVFGSHLIVSIGTTLNTDSKPTIQSIAPIMTLFVFIVILTLNTTLFTHFVYQSNLISTSLTLIINVVIYTFVMFLVYRLMGITNFNGYLYIPIALLTLCTLVFSFLEGFFAGPYIINFFIIVATSLFDIAWFALLSEVIEETFSPLRTFGLGILARVIGKITGNVLAQTMVVLHLASSQITILLLIVIVLNLFLLPPLRYQLSLVLKDNGFVNIFAKMNPKEQDHIISTQPYYELLTEREKEILQLLLAGKSNKDIGNTLFIGESTVKSHVSNIFGKFQVNSRAEIISILLGSKND